MAHAPRGRCAICRHPKRAEIEWRLARGQPYRAVAAQYGKGTSGEKDSMCRHANHHMSQTLKARLATKVLIGSNQPDELEAYRAGESSGLLARIAWSRAKLYELLELAERGKDVYAILGVHRALNSNLSLTGHLLGEFSAAASMINSATMIATSPDYLRLRGLLLTALRKHPAALRDVLRALREVEDAAVTTEVSATSADGDLQDGPAPDFDGPAA